MTCPIAVRLGVYALGAADATECALVESHLAACSACRTELARLAPLPALLARVPVHLLRTDPLPATLNGRAPTARSAQPVTAPGWTARALAGRWRSVVGLAAAAALGTAGGFWLAQPGASQSTKNSPPAAITMSGINPVTHVRVTATLTGTTWGTSIWLTAWGLPRNQPCELIVRSRTGETEVTGTWDAWRAGPVSVPASAAWRPADISSLQVASTSGNLVTITALGSAAHVPLPSLPKGPRH